jgi:diguanylate cyclase (GGDEF)-like protein
MKNKDVDGIADANASADAVNVSKLSGRRYEELVSPPVSDLVNKERLVAEAAEAVVQREERVTAREQAVYARENAIDMLAKADTLQALLNDKVKIAQATSVNQINMLQHVNAKLVVSSIEAHKVADQIETTKVELHYLAHHDALTALPNRMLLQDRINQAIELARRSGTQLAVMFLDLDRFKHINDSLGHAVGDLLLQSVARSLLGCVRHSDTISRQGGDEFVVLLPSIEHAADAALSAQKILLALALPHQVDGHVLHVSVSVGVSIYPYDGEDAETLIKSADTAMYCAKESGRNNYKFFEAEMNARAVLRHSVEVSLRLALERDEFVLHYQPKVNLHTDTIVGVEALIRWQHPERGLLLPAHFVSIAEDCGLILPIGRWVLREACRQAQAWREAGLPALTIAVNTSALEFRAKDFIENIRVTLEQTFMDASQLEIELTESVLMRDAISTDCVLHALVDMGIKLAVDDFGTGYSSLSYLRRFPVETLKIDQSFVEHLSSSSDDASMISAVINMGKSLKKRIIAEGVETADQCAFLIAQQCDEGQGYFFGRPMSAAELGCLLRVGRAPQIN